MFKQSAMATIDWGQHPCMSSQCNKNMTTLDMNNVIGRILIIFYLHEPSIYGYIS